MAVASLALRRALAVARASSALASSALAARRSFSSSSPIAPLFGAPVVVVRRPPCSFVQSQFFRSSAPLANRRFDRGNESDKISPDEILFEGCDYNHWLITMDFPKDPAPTREEMIETYVQTLAKVVGSVEEAKKRMYACSTTTYQGFQAVMTEEMSEKFNGLPGVVFVLPDSYIDPVNKEYGGDKYENGIITPRPPPIQANRRPRPRFENRNDEPSYNRPPQGNMPPDQHGMMRRDGRDYAPQQSYGPPLQDGNRGFGPGDNRGPMPSNQRSFQGNQGNYAPQDRRGFGQENQGNFAPQDQRNFEHAARGDNFQGHSGYGVNRQEPGPGYTVNRQQQAPGYHNNYGQGGNSSYGGGQVGGYGHVNDHGQGPNSTSGQQNYSGPPQGQSGSWQERQ